MVDIDYDIYRAKVEQSGLSPAEFNRQALLTSTVKQKVPKELVDGIKQLGRIGNNLNQIAAKAHTLNALDVQRYDENCRKLDEAVKTITAAVILPRPMK